MPSGASRLAVKNRSAIAPFGEMLSPLFSPDQRWFIFQYNGTDLVAQPLSTQGRYLLYARDLHSPDVQSNATYLVSPATAPSVAGITRSFSATGDLMAYDSLYYAPVRYGEIRVFDFRALQNLSICSNCARPSLSADGRLVAYTSWRTNGNDTHGDVYVQDRIGGTRALISRNSSSGQPANGPSENPLITANGRYVVFTSRASDLVSSDTNAVQDLFVRDRYRGITYLLSATASGLSADGRSRRPVASSDGLTIAFQSYAGNLVPGDYNHALDIFVVRLGAGDSDLDGLDDAWEITYFDDLTRDGSGDSDTDGQTDLHEYISGTDPTNAGSHLEVISIQPSPNSVRLMWSSVPGKEYQIQIRASLSAGAWQNLSSVVRATTTQTSWSHSRTNYAAQSYYRAALVQ
jgi:Tol biopolymer transport system component